MSTRVTSIQVSGAAVLLPGADSVAALADGGPAPGGTPPEPAAHVGRKGLRYKDRATQLGYCLAAAALRDAGLLDGEAPTVPGATIGVVASSNLGNLDTVARAVDTLRTETVSGTSPMDLPNASSNVIASSAAIRYQLHGPNVMLCNGATSGLDAVHWAATMLRAGRATRVLVLGVEPDNDVVRRLLDGRPTVDGGAAVVLETANAADARDVPARAVVGRYARAAGAAAVADRLASGGDTAPGQAPWQPPEHAGHASGALGVLQCAAAVGSFDDGGTAPVHALAGTDTDDACAGLELLPPRSAPAGAPAAGTAAEAA